METSISDKQAEESSVPEHITQQAHQQASEVVGQGLQSNFMENYKYALVHLNVTSIEGIQVLCKFYK